LAKQAGGGATTILPGETEAARGDKPSHSQLQSQNFEIHLHLTTIGKHKPTIPATPARLSESPALHSYTVNEGTECGKDYPLELRDGV
jgi:hypothetical protein